MLEPGAESRRHTHERQDELYFVHAGTPEIEIEGVVHPLRPGSAAHVPAAVRAATAQHTARTRRSS